MYSDKRVQISGVPTLVHLDASVISHSPILPSHASSDYADIKYYVCTSLFVLTTSMPGPQEALKLSRTVT